MAGMGEQTIYYATGTCRRCLTGVRATGWHQEFKDALAYEGPDGDAPVRIPGLVEWTGWRHINIDMMHPTDGPDKIVTTNAGEAILAGDMRPIGGCGRVGHPAGGHVCTIGGVAVDFTPIESTVPADCCPDCVERCTGYCTLCHNKPEPAAEIVHRYPHTVKWSDVVAFLCAIGVDPIDERSMNLVKIEPHGVTFKRFREMPGDEAKSTKYVTAVRNGRDGHGKDRPYGYGDVATQITTAQIRWDE